MAPPAPTPDGTDAAADLARRATSGDADSLAALLERYLPRLRAFVRLRVDASVRARESASDLVQTVCREVLQNAGQFEYRDEDRFRAWLFQTALNKIRDRARYHHAVRRAPRAEVSGDALEHADDRSALQSASQQAIARETAEAMERAFDLLSEEHREVITLSRIVGLPHAAIAQAMDRSEVAVRGLLSRALVAYMAALDRTQGRR
jgi:RNA polymerase sigma-70 factor, ECF subfamily